MRAEELVREEDSAESRKRDAAAAFLAAADAEADGERKELVVGCLQEGHIHACGVAVGVGGDDSGVASWLAGLTA
jgi:hypothetical protein